MNIALNKTANASSFVAPYSPQRAVDGSISPTQRWVCTNLPGWMYVDFGQPFWINRWVVKLMGYAGWGSSYNMSDFKFQGSNDLNTWSNIDIVAGSSANIVDHTFQAVKFRYVRIYADTGIPVNRKLAAFVEIEVYDAPPTSSYLSNLAVLNGRQSFALVPSFDKATINYNVSVPNNISSVTVRPTAEDANATIKVNGNVVSSGSVSNAILLSVGNNIINVEVTPQIGDVKKTYTVTVARLS